MFGFGDVWVLLAYVLTFGSVILCVVYGIINWNNPIENQEEECKEEAVWEKHDPDLNKGGSK